MDRTRASFAGLALTLTSLAVALPVLPAAALTTYVTSVVAQATDTNSATFAGGTGSPRVSRDGEWLGFSRLTGTGSYVKSLVSGTTTLVSLNDAGQPANQPSSVEGISQDGSVVLFATAATNMGDGAATARDLYLRDRTTGHTERVNLLGGPGSATAVKAGESTLSDGGTVVAFAATNNHVYARSLANHLTDQVDVSSGEVSGNGGSGQPSLSSDGRFATFTSSSTNLSANDLNFASDVFERDRQAGTTTRVSLTDADGAPNLGSDESSVSDDGQIVAFASDGDNLVVGDTNSSTDVFVRSLTSSYTLRVSVGYSGVEGSGSASRPDLSGQGAYVAFESTSENLDVSQKNGHSDVFVRDISGNLTTQADLSPTSGPALGGFAPSLATANGAVGFTTPGVGPVATDDNNAPDAFVQHPAPLGPFTSFTPLVSSLLVDFGASAAGTAARVNDLYGGRLTTAHLLVQLAHDPAWAVDREPVARLYQAFFLREPDLGGLKYWVKKRSAGTKLSVIAASFATSSEFQNTYGSLDDHDFVGLVYANVLQRKPDSAGLAHWVAKLAGGMTRGDMMVAFSESSEGRRILAPEVDATLVGLAMLHAMAPKALWLAAAAAGREHAMAEWGAFTYLNSPAYGALHP